MTDLEKILTGLAACMPQTEDDAAIGCDGCPYNGHPCGGDYQDNDHVNLPVRLIEDIRALLKAQEPVPPVKVNRYMDTDENGDWYVPETYDCGNCGVELHGKANYCHLCGRAVKWE